MIYIKPFNDFINESKLELDDHVWTKINPHDHPELKEEFFNLISIAYKELGGHTKIHTAEDIFSDPQWTYWKGIHLHGSPGAIDAILFGKVTKFGIKYAGVGHDGKKDSKTATLEEEADEFKALGHYAEVSGKLAEILLNKYKVPVVEKQEDVEKVLGTKVKWLGRPTESIVSGSSWYERSIGGSTFEKIMVGRPKGI
jgi:hypothetical protein